MRGIIPAVALPATGALTTGVPAGARGSTRADAVITWPGAEIVSTRTPLVRPSLRSEAGVVNGPKVAFPPPRK